VVWGKGGERSGVRRKTEKRHPRRLDKIDREYKEGNKKTGFKKKKEQIPWRANKKSLKEEDWGIENKTKVEFRRGAGNKK